jgi:hypothetical protein
MFKPTSIVISAVAHLFAIIRDYPINRLRIGP